jgi:hypothetical protein
VGFDLCGLVVLGFDLVGFVVIMGCDDLWICEFMVFL